MTPFPLLYLSYCLLKFSFACLTGSYLSLCVSSLMPRALWHLGRNPFLTYGWAQPILNTPSRLLCSVESFCLLRSLCSSLVTRRSLCSRSSPDCSIGGSAPARCSLCRSSAPHRAGFRSSRSFCFIWPRPRPFRSLCGCSGPRRFLCRPCPNRSLRGSSRLCRSLCARTSSWPLHSDLWT